MTSPVSTDPYVEDTIRQLIAHLGADPESYSSTLMSQVITTALKLLSEKHDLGQLKVIARAVKEMRYAYRIFNRYKLGPCISIFGSARTPQHHPDYQAAKDFSQAMAEAGWMCITGGANGIMRASTEGPQKEQSFGLSIKLPFEAPANDMLEGDPKLIIFRYFFTRKLMFMSHSHALAAFPGGFGTLDELFEMLTLIQTGKANIIPIVLLEGEGGRYWEQWRHYIHNHLLKNHWISQEDERLYFLAPGPKEAVDHILQFYKRYHSSRYVKDTLVIRLKTALSPQQIEALNDKYGALLAGGTIAGSPPLPEEEEFAELPRLILQHTRRDFSLLRLLIDDINDF